MVYRRHTNFAIESVKQIFNGTPGFNKKVSCTISRNGDLITDVFLEVKMTRLASATKTWWPAEALIKEVELEIGGQRIDKHNSTWLRIYDELFRKDDDKDAYARMVNFTAEEQAATNAEVEKRFYVPLVFFFNRNPGLAIPLIALQYHEVKLNFTFENEDIMENAGIKKSVAPDVELYVDYIYLDTDERRRFAQVSHEYLITQIQHTGDETATHNSGSNQNLRLNLNHPCKYLAWVFANPNEHGHFAGNKASRDVSSEFLAPLKNAKLQLNGHDRASERHGAYFNYTQPWQTLRAKPRAGVYLYSFSLKPDEHQPSGSCNMSRIDNATLVLNYKEKGLATTREANVANVVKQVLSENKTTADVTDLTALRLYAENYNVLRVMSGMGGLSYSS